MKTINMLLLLIISITSWGNDEKYFTQMGKHVQAVYTAKSSDEFQAAVNAFDRIASAEKSKWEPYYYSAYGNIMMAINEKDGAKKDSYLDLALVSIEKGKALAPDESELVALEGFAYMIQLTVDPATRGQKYSILAMQTFGKAVGMDKNNPRALALLAQMQLGTAKFFNQPPTEACETARKAAGVFDSAEEPVNPLAPRWGKEMNLEFIQNCK
jgi:hypothetical protein